jgi:predicted 2-oxoglutarate/Fe(II)-dependent dioxygenase YbiX
MNRQEQIYPIPLITRPLPAAVKIPGFLSTDHCARLIALANEKGFEAIRRSRHGQDTFSASGCWLRPEDDELVFRLFANQAAQTNADHWRLPLAGIYSPMSVLRYKAGDWIRPHIDADYRLADGTKLTAIVQLVPAADFSGGRLTIAETETYELDAGDAVIFPAHMLHTVSAIDSGERYILAAWIQGHD